MLQIFRIVSQFQRLNDKLLKLSEKFLEPDQLNSECWNTEWNFSSGSRHYVEEVLKRSSLLSNIFWICLDNPDAQEKCEGTGLKVLKLYEK